MGLLFVGSCLVLLVAYHMSEYDVSSEREPLFVVEEYAVRYEFQSSGMAHGHDVFLTVPDEVHGWSDYVPDDGPVR